jgi:hypothetical protein
MWVNWDIIYHALSAEWLSFPARSVTLVSGNCPPRRSGEPGADYICETIWEGWGGPVERHPAEWRVNGVVNYAAGFERNAYMAALPDIYKCLAFQLDGSSGTENCMNCAKQRHIPISLYELRS